MEDCIVLAKRLGQRVGNELSLPSICMKRRQRIPTRESRNIRKGQYEGLKAEIESNPERAPDFGPSTLGAAGATVIGAPQSAHRLQCLSHQRRCGYRKENRQGHSSFIGGLRM
jgi:glutamate formiminotransferase